MGKLRPVGSEKLQGIDKINRMIEISQYRLNTPTPINEVSSNEFKKTLSDGNTYHIVKEKNGYIIKRGIYESVSEYIEPMKSRKYYPSYSQALKRLNLITKEVNSLTGYGNNLSLFNEDDNVKYFLRQEQNEQTPAPAPAPVAPNPAPPALAPTEMQTPAPVPTDIPEPEDDTDMEEPINDTQGDKDEVVTYKTIQKLVGRLGQKTREFLSNEENEMNSNQIKYIVNSILSALPLDSLDEEDREEIITKFEGGEEDMGDDVDMGDEVDMGDDVNMDFEGESLAPTPPTQPAPETAESYHHRRMGSKPLKGRTDRMKEVIENVFSESKVDNVLNKYFNSTSNKNTKTVKRLSESYAQEKKITKLLNENSNMKIVGRNKNSDILLIKDNKLYTINSNGNLI